MSPSRLPAHVTVAATRDDALVPEVVAWEAPETRRSFAAYRLGALRWFAAGLGSVALAIGLSAYAVLVLKRPGLGVFIVAAVLLGIIGLVTGAGGLLRAVRFGNALRRDPWRAGELRVAGAHLRLVFPGPRPGAGAGADTDAGEDDGSTALDVRLMTTSRWRVRAVVGHRDSQVLVCPVGDGEYVLTAEGLGNLYGLRRLKPQLSRNRP